MSETVYQLTLPSLRPRLLIVYLHYFMAQQRILLYKVTQMNHYIGYFTCGLCNLYQVIFDKIFGREKRIAIFKYSKHVLSNVQTSGSQNIILFMTFFFD